MENSSHKRLLFVPWSFTPYGFLPVAYMCSLHTDTGILAEQELGPELFSHAANIFKIGKKKKKTKKKKKEEEKRKDEKRKQAECLFQIGLEQEK